MIVNYDVRTGTRLTPAMVTLATASTPMEIYRPHNGIAAAAADAVQVNSSSFVIRKVHVYNNSGGGVHIQFGIHTGVSFVQEQPDLYCPNGVDSEWREDDLPNYEYFQALTVQTPSTPSEAVLVQVEVEEYQNATAPV